MKKVMPILLTLGLLALIFQFIVNLFIDHHQVKYSIKTDTNIYLVDENFEKIDDESIYDFSILDENNSLYTVSYTKDFNNQEKVIKDIKYFTTDDLKCIFPIFNKNSFLDVSCLYDGEQVSYSYLKQINNSDIDMVTNKLKKLGYESDSWKKKSSTSIKSDNRVVKVYNKNILEDYVFTIWNYKGIYIITQDGIVEKELFDKDQYENKYSALVGKYYVTAGSVDDLTSISEFYYYNVGDFGKGTITLDTSISTDFYFNGVYDDKLYVTDVGARKQYVIDPAYETVKEVGNKDAGYKVLKNGKLQVVSMSEFFEDEVYFTNLVNNKKITQKYGDVEIHKDGNFYYFKTNNGEVYRSYEDNPANGIKLFQFSDISEWKVLDGDISVVTGDTLYFYNDEVGLSQIAVNSELLYNYENICDFLKK